MAGTAREEAERLVATVLAIAAQSGLGGAPHSRSDDDTLSGTAHRIVDGLGTLGHTITGWVAGDRPPGDSAPAGGSTASGRPSGARWASMDGWATGSAECCVCPICRAIAGLRDPSPENAERLATGAGDFAAGVAGLMRGLSALRSEPRPARRSRPAPPAAPDSAWSAATRGDAATHGDSAAHAGTAVHGDSAPHAGTAAHGDSAPHRGAAAHDGAAAHGGAPRYGGAPVPDDLAAAPDDAGDADGSPWSAATRESYREARAAEQAARAARHTARLAEQEARRAERLAAEEARRAQRLAEAAARADQPASDAGTGPPRADVRGTGAPWTDVRGTGAPRTGRDVWAEATAGDAVATPGPGGGTVPGSGAGAGAEGIRPRTPASASGPRTHDVVEFDQAREPGAVAAPESGMAGTDNMDHDVADPAAGASGDAEPGAGDAPGGGV